MVSRFCRSLEKFKYRNSLRSGVIVSDLSAVESLSAVAIDL